MVRPARLAGSVRLTPPGPFTAAAAGRPPSLLAARAMLLTGLSSPAPASNPRDWLMARAATSARLAGR
jgi:hypothetical protein